METKELISQISERMGRDNADVKKLLDALSTVIAERCGELDSVAVPGFGMFESKKIDERVTVNPASGKRMLIPPTIVMGFKPSNVLKSKLK